MIRVRLACDIVKSEKEKLLGWQKVLSMLRTLCVKEKLVVFSLLDLFYFTCYRRTRSDCGCEPLGQLAHGSPLCWLPRLRARLAAPSLCPCGTRLSSPTTSSFFLCIWLFLARGIDYICIFQIFRLEERPLVWNPSAVEASLLWTLTKLITLRTSFWSVVCIYTSF